MGRKFASTRNQSGQALMVFVLFLGAMLGFTAMAIDVGLFYEDRRHLQNSADAAALAGAAELPLRPDLAMQSARQWANNNGVANHEIKTLEVRTTSFPNDTIVVELNQNFNWIFGRALGRTTDDVGARAAARSGSLAGGHDMMPWALLQGESPCLDAQGDAILNAGCSVKVGASDGIGGWRGALDFDGNGGGAAEYKANIIDGTTDWKYCIEGDSSPGCVSSVSVIDALDGNKVGPTGSGIDERVATPACDSNLNGKDDFEEVFRANPTSSPAYITVARRASG